MCFVYIIYVPVRFSSVIERSDPAAVGGGCERQCEMPFMNETDFVGARPALYGLVHHECIMGVNVGTGSCNTKSINQRKYTVTKATMNSVLPCLT